MYWCVGLVECVVMYVVVYVIGLLVMVNVLCRNV